MMDRLSVLRTVMNDIAQRSSLGLGEIGAVP